MHRTFSTKAREWSGVVALFIALGTGGAYAADLIRSGDIADGAVLSRHIKAANVRGSDIKADAVTSAKVADGALLVHDFAAGQLPRGDQGPAGPVGPAGPPGPAGPAGGPDPPQQVLDKLKHVDGEGSGLDADLLDGESATELDQGVLLAGETERISDFTGAMVSVTCPQGFWMARVIHREQHVGGPPPPPGVTWEVYEYSESTYEARASTSGDGDFDVRVDAICVSD